MASSRLRRAVISPEVLVNETGGEAVLLHLKTERYFGMDAVGTRMWQAITTAASLEAAFSELLEEYDVEPEPLRRDFDLWVTQLAEAGLIELRDA
jgi:hypothetical protein